MFVRLNGILYKEGGLSGICFPFSIVVLSFFLFHYVFIDSINKKTIFFIIISSEILLFTIIIYTHYIE